MVYVHTFLARGPRGLITIYEYSAGQSLPLLPFLFRLLGLHARGGPLLVTYTVVRSRPLPAKFEKRLNYIIPTKVKPSLTPVSAN